MNTFVRKNHPLYPHSLLETDGFNLGFSAPELLYYKGNLEVLRAPCLAIVGTRQSTAYGNQLAFDFAKKLALRGVTIVSGLAFGIDAEAHRGALAAGGPTVAVLAQAIEELQPSGHRGLAEEIVRRGGLLLSEYAPGQITYKSDYLVRNRLIAGLCKTTVVVEAGLRSGALNTAKHALEFGRDVFCVPGRIGDPQSAGCLHAIHEGRSGVLPSLEILLESLALKKSRQLSVQLNLEGFSMELYREVQKNPRGIGALSELFSDRLSELYPCLMDLEMRGLLHLTPQGVYCAVSGAG